MDEGELARHVASLGKRFSIVKKEMGKIVIGQKDIIDFLLQALLCDGHVLLEGIPGVGKTLIIRTLSTITGSSFSRIQFTPDLLPSDIVGITTYEEGKGFYTVKGPIFANFVLGDEINRSPPKVQSALLEGMQERQVTIGKETFQLPKPFFVMATQNPVEQLGTYKLPEAQLDRFLFKLQMSYPTATEEVEILETNMTTKSFDSFNLQPVFSAEEIVEAQRIVNNIVLSKKMQQYIIRIVTATRHAKEYGIDFGKYINYGASPRSSIALFISAKAHALMSGNTVVSPVDIKAVAKPVLRHRIILNFEGQAENISSDEIIDEILKKVPVM
ncbi:MAG: MoxR family ATPase [Candidatus Woesearchaeota archaeon]|nr:MAG: MoxR family ATPase [Candidatus Woesearchaeota archaeon]